MILSSSNRKNLRLALSLVLTLVFIYCSWPSLASEQDLHIDIDTGRVFAYYRADSTLWIGTFNCLLRWKVGSTSLPSRVNIQTGIVHAFFRVDSTTLWIGTDYGLFSWKVGSEDNPIPVDVDFVDKSIPYQPTDEIVYRFYKIKSTIYIVTGNGLLKWTIGSKEKPVRIPFFNRYNRIIQLIGSTFWSSSIGLFNWTPETMDRPVQVDADKDTNSSLYNVASLCQIDSTLWIGTDNGLYSWKVGSKEKIIRVPTDMETRGVHSFYRADKTLWIGAFNNLFRWTIGSKEKPAPVFLGNSGIVGYVHAFYPDESTLWIVADGGLFRWTVGSKDDPIRVPTNEDTDRVLSVYRTGSILWIGAEKGLFYWMIGSNAPPAHISIDTGDNSEPPMFYQADSTLWIGAAKGLFRIDIGKWNSTVEITSSLPYPFYKGNERNITWKISDYAWHTTPNLVRCHVIVEEENKLHNKKFVYDVVPGAQSFLLRNLSDGNYKMTVQAIDLFGNVIASKPVSFTVFNSVQDVIKEWTKKVAGGYALLTLFIFCILVVGSRRSEQCFRLLTDPTIRKFGLYFGAVLQYASPIRIWVFERYFQTLKADLENEFKIAHTYVPMPLQRPDKTTTLTSNLLPELQQNRRLWVHGLPGTGKTEMIKELMRQYCSETSLRAAWRKYRFIPILITVRKFEIKAIPELARAALAGKKLDFADTKFFERLLKAGGFLIILDGLNEADLEKPLSDFIAQTSSVRVLITSQKPANDKDITDYELPPLTVQQAKDLLTAFVGEEKSKKAIDQSTPQLWADIKSGYDVQLLADLIDAGQGLPQDRLSLYRETLNRASSFYRNGSFPENIIYHKAWDFWKVGIRRFEEDGVLIDEILEPLKKAQVVVPRDDKYQFRHDLMRGYLAACWAVKEAASTQQTITRLKEEEVWKLGITDQDEVFPFIGDLLDTKKAIETVAQFAADAPEERGRLSVAMKEAAKRKHFRLNIVVE